MSSVENQTDGNFEFNVQALAELMPMCLIVARDGTILHTGPTLDRMGNGAMVGQDFFDTFQVRRPRRISLSKDIGTLTGQAVHLRLKQPDATQFRAVVVKLEGEGGKVLVNLSFGIHVSEAVSQHSLTIGDFAATDLAVEMLYLIESKSAAMKESRKLNLKLEAARAVAEENSITDALTGLPNRRGVERLIDNKMHRGQPLAVLAIDLDYFKPVNDTHGYAAGDAVLVETAERFKRLLDVKDVVARLGGDEFLVLVEEFKSTEELLALGEALIQTLERPIPFEGRSCEISASIGIAFASGFGISVDATLKRADAALYRAKENGRRQAVLSDRIGDHGSFDKLPQVG